MSNKVNYNCNYSPLYGYVACRVAVGWIKRSGSTVLDPPLYLSR